MELKVWVEGIQRIVCGVTESTTCQDIVYALAHATGKSGRFTLIERWRNNERQLAPNENPLKILLKWGEYSNDVQFILQRTDINKNSTPSRGTSSSVSPIYSFSSSRSTELFDKSKNSPERFKDSADKMKESQKSLAFSGTYNTSSDNIGIVKGIPQVKTAHLEVRDNYNSPKELNESPSHRIAIHPLAPPPYRDPPPPTSSTNYDKFKKTIQDPCKSLQNKIEHKIEQKIEESALYNTQYRELVSLVNYQREKLSTQQADLTKFDAEIVYWEGKEREKQFQLDFVSQEILTVNNSSRINSEQVIKSF